MQNDDLMHRGGWKGKTLKTMETKVFFQFEIIMNVLVSSFQTIWIPMLWVYDHWNYFNSFSVWIVFRRENLPSTDSRFWRIKTVHSLKEPTSLPPVICNWLIATAIYKILTILE